MIKVLIAKSAASANAARAYIEPDIVLCPEKVDFGAWYPTTLFNEVLFKPCGEWIEEAHNRKTRHVARIQTMAVTIAAESGDSNIAILSADVTPPSGWLERLAKNLTGNIGMAAGIVPTGYDNGVKAWHLDGRLMTTEDEVGFSVFDVRDAAVDCCVLTSDAAKALIPLSGDELTEWEIGRKLKLAGLRIVINPLVQCLHG